MVESPASHGQETTRMNSRLLGGSKSDTNRDWSQTSSDISSPMQHFAFYPVLPSSFQPAVSLMSASGGEDEMNGQEPQLTEDMKAESGSSADAVVDHLSPPLNSASAVNDKERDDDDVVGTDDDANANEMMRLQKEIEDAQQKAFERFVGIPNSLRTGFPMTPSLLAALQGPFASLNSQLLLAAGMAAGGGGGGGPLGVGGGGESSFAADGVDAGGGGSPDATSDQPEDLSVNSSTTKKETGSDAGVNSPLGGVVDGGESQQTWSYEEQFKQLYELSDDPKRKEWLDEWLSFMHRIGKPVTRIPIMAKQVLDLYELYRLVVQHGGLVEIINKKLWREITKGLNLPSSITSAAFTLRTQYQKYLYDFECEKECLSTPADLQLAIEGNRREGRRNNSSGFNPYPSLISHHHHQNSAAVAAKHHMNGPAVTAAQILGRSFSGASNSEDDGSAATMAAAVAAAGGLMGMAGPVAAQQAVLAAYRAEHVAAIEAQRHMEQARRVAADSLQRQMTMMTNNQGSGRASTSSNDTEGETASHGEIVNGQTAAKRPRLLGNGEVGAGEPTGHASLLNGVPSTHLKITSKGSGTDTKLNSLVVSMEIDGVMYQGVLYASLSPTASSQTSHSASATTPLQINTGPAQ